ncbi:hypothetical protein ACS8FD_02315 [Psychrobacter sp. 1U2]|uniref:hypothetical protein n=1 Tax=Psychrobacter sp. 1U2 TaxID=3453577 RepID=UPI003F448D47
MNQTFILKLASDSLISDAQKIGVPATRLQQIAVKVTASIADLANTDSDDLNAKTSAVNTSLNLSYEIKLPSIPLLEQLQWPLWSKDKVGFEDYLWEQTCLECFITNNPASYVEINASPDGQYAVYQFTDYRTPATLPPTPLLIKDSQGPVRIQWHDTALTSSDILTKQRRVSISLDKLPYPILNPDSTALIHPCVILYFNEIPLYFAPYHASPADFHQRKHWSMLQFGKQLWSSKTKK